MVVGVSHRGIEGRVGARAIARACGLLDAFSADQPELGLAALADRARLPRSTARRLLLALEGAALIEQDAASRRYGLGLKLARLGAVALARLDLVRAATGPMRGLVARVGEAAYLARLIDASVLYLVVIQGPSTVRLTAQVGMLLPAHSTATGKVLLAALSPAAVSQRLPRSLARLTPNTVTGPAELRRELAQVRRQGFAITYDEHTVGSCSVAAPVRDHTGEVVSALAVSGPSYRLSRTHLQAMSSQVLGVATTISSALGSHA